MADSLTTTGYLERQISTLALSPVRVGNPMSVARAASWHNRLFRLGMALPLFAPHDLGLMLTGEGWLEGIVALAPGVRGTLPKRLIEAYVELLGACAESELARTAATWRVRDDIVVALLQKLIAPVWESWPERRLWVGAHELPIDPATYADLGDGSGYARFDAAPPRSLLEHLVRSRLQILTTLEQIDLDTVRFFGLFYREGAAGTVLDLADLIHVFSSPEANGIVNFSMDLIPSLLETRRQGGAQRFSIDGYASIERRGSVDSIVLSEFAYEDDIFAQKVLDNELYFYGHEKQRQQERHLHYLLVDSSASMRGEREVFARGLALALWKKLALGGQEVMLRFFDSRLYEAVRMSGAGAEASLPYLLSFRSERGRNYSRVVQHLTAELQRTRRERGDQGTVVYLITHGQCHIDAQAIQQLVALVRVYGVFILPSSALHLDYLDLLERYQIVDAEALASRRRSVDRALEIVGDATRRTARESGDGLARQSPTRA